MVRTMALRRYASPQCGPNGEEEMPKIVAEAQACFQLKRLQWAIESSLHFFFNVEDLS